jgi:tetratricopeptide (TPR) repeat protein
MRFNRFLLFLFFVFNFSFFSFSKPISSSIDSLNWSIIPKLSRLYSLETKTKINSNEILNQLKKIENNLSLNKQLRALDSSPPLIFPVSAGIYSGSFKSDSLSAYEQLIFLYRNLCDRSAEAGAIHSYGIHTALNGDMNESLNIFSEALAINATLKNSAGVIKNHQSMMRIHAFMGNYFNAVKLGNILVDLSLRSQNNVSLADTYLLLSQILISQNNFKDAESLIMLKALPLLYYKLNDKIGAIKCYDQLAFIYERQKRFSEAKWFYIQSNLLAQKIGHSESIVNSLINLAHVKMAIGDSQLALEDIKEAERISVKNQYKYQLIEIKKDLNELYTKLGDINAANLAFLEFTDLSSIYIKNNG